jgi:hypothetical protein
MIEREHLALFGEAFARLAWWRRVPALADGAPIGRLLHRKRETAQEMQQERPPVTPPRMEPTTPSAPRPPSPPATASGDRMKRLLEAKRRAKPS